MQAADTGISTIFTQTQYHSFADYSLLTFLRYNPDWILSW